ncbi:winged helix DNA-binding domain-containing protein [Nocardioides KLBMP 9356]|uniref:Winged helix DNA-binding domain-containing protein n=1 Tax=Nocardioides potassii TaxID=2911371 RepID=A0ABS9HIU8_9ACTN|nr:crosslink repair DNA glycosylase YcaQ family protein [Nocardioides potassii]MCF6380018.1 winged helix DNA-binding domain-containing protein [Nocardioides potassii]
MRVPEVTRQQALTWRLQRQHLTVGAASVVEVVRTLAAVSVFASDPDLAVRRRLDEPGEPGEVQRALADGRLVRTFSFRGSVQVMAPETAGAYLAVRSAGRQWALRSWVDHYRLEPDDWPELRALVREVVANGPVPPQEIADAVTGTRFDHLAREFAEPNVTLIKPLCWQGDVVLGPDQSVGLTLQSPAAASAWAGIPPLDEAGPQTVLEYVGTYGPCTREHLDHWLGGGLSAGRARLARWWAEVDESLAEVDVDGETRWVLADDLPGLVDVRPESSVVLLPGKDDWVMGPGTKDEWVVPAECRTSMTRGANPVLVDAVVRGTWRLSGGAVEVDAPAAPSDVTAREVERLEALLRTP